MGQYADSFVCVLALTFAVVQNPTVHSPVSSRVSGPEVSATLASSSGGRLSASRLLVNAAGEPMKESGLYASNLQTDSKLSAREFIPDGNLDKKVWKQAKRVRFDHDWAGIKTYPEAETHVATIWSPTYLYVAFWCKYTTLNIYEGEEPAKERWQLWDRDVVEVFINPSPEHLNHYYEFEVAPNNQWIDLEITLDRESYDASWESHFEHATHIDPKNHVWTCEMRIPVGPMGVRMMHPNAEWRINFYRADGPGDDSVRRFLAWSPTLGEKANFHVPTRFGLIRFVK